MGSTFSTMHVFNKQQAKPTQIKKLFSEHMKKKGFAPADEDSASRSYQFVFSKNSNWITVILPNQEIGEPDEKEAEDMSKALKCVCLETYVCDSDFAMLRLVDSVNGRKDTVFVGDDEMLEGYGIESKGINRECWEPLLADGRTWEELVRAWEGEYVFAEDALTEMAPILGMDIKSVQDGGLSFENESKHYKVLDLHFKEAGKKAVSLNTAFKQVFGEALEPLGFKKIKSKYPYFVRLIGDEIAHVIVCQNEWCAFPGHKCFNITSGVFTVYRGCIDPKDTSEWHGRLLGADLTISPKDNGIWLMDISYFYWKNAGDEYDNDLRNNLREYCYKEGDAASIYNELRRSLEATLKYVLPNLDSANSLEACITFFLKFGMTRMTFHKGHDFESSWTLDSEAFLLLKTNGRDFIKHVGEQLILYDRYLNDPVWHEKTLAELARRKAAYIEAFRLYGINV